MDLASVVTTIGAAATGVSAVVAATEYRLKARAQRVEIDTKLSEAFAELVQLANARPASGQAVGVATQAGVTASLGELGSRHKVLQNPARQSLKVLRETAATAGHGNLVAACDEALLKVGK